MRQNSTQHLRKINRFLLTLDIIELLPRKEGGRKEGQTNLQNKKDIVLIGLVMSCLFSVICTVLGKWYTTFLGTWFVGVRVFLGILLGVRG